MEDYHKEIILILKDAFVAMIILSIVLSSLFIYTGRWPPMVVVESPSMSHGEGNPPASELGVIDTGDIVAVKSVDNREDVVTYIEGKGTGYKTYGQYGDVIVFRPDGSQDYTPVIHRPILYLQFNETSQGFDIPALSELQYSIDWETSEGEKVYGLSETLILYDYGHRDVTVTIELENFIEYEHSGFITMGDNNIRNDRGIYDQGNLVNINEPIRTEWVEGKARGELPWFGSIKLVYLGRTDSVPSNTWRNLVISIILLISLPIILEYGVDYYKENKKDKDQDDQKCDETEKKKIIRIK
ncbi:MAG: S26 family signal peptidase [Candidatus Saliniplasma sp.]